MPDDLHRPPPDAARAQQIALAALGLALAALGAYILQGFLRALVWSVIFALAVWPLYCWARHRWPARGHDIMLPALFTLAVTLIFLVPLVAVGIEIGREGDERRQAGARIPAHGHPCTRLRAQPARWQPGPDGLVASEPERSRKPVVAARAHQSRSVPGLQRKGRCASCASSCDIRVHVADAVLPVAARRYHQRRSCTGR